ncbi:MAG: nuclear transport factor 2 family protein [Spirochaetaceae bacterium]|nr:MAG: nuclear transport factor 2 family protein [Spirochaetaceae bacterium]
MNKSLLYVVSLVIVGLLIGGCATTGRVDPDLVRMEIEAIFADYSAAANAEDTDAWIALWDVDGIQMPPGAPAVVGRDAIYQRVRPVHQMMDLEGFSITVEEVEAAGPWAYARGVYTVSMTPKAGGATNRINGKYLTVFRRQPDGSLRIYRDCFNPS